MIKKRQKRGELTTKQLVTIIILIVSFIIVLALLFRLNLGETTDKEICRNSVALRGQNKLISGPLDCRTNYLCVSGGGDCDGISSTQKTGVDPNSKNEVMKAIADEMSSCWFQFGEGKINYGAGLASKAVHCGICSIVEFDEKTRENFPTITYNEFYEFLQTNAKEGSQSYMNYLYGVNSVNNVADKEYFNVDLDKGFIDTSQKQSILTGIDMNLKFLFLGNDDRILNTFIIPTSKTSQTSCKEFITKA